MNGTVIAVTIALIIHTFIFTMIARDFVKMNKKERSKK